MKRNQVLMGLLAYTIIAPVFAQTSVNDVQRDVNQQQRIEQGLKSGSLTTKEAGKLEKEESRVDRLEANSMKDGKISPAEQRRINRTENKVSQDIYREKHDAQTGNPASASSQRMQADVQRNINQEQRIDNGLKDGSLSKREAARLERQQARIDRKEARAAHNGHVGAGEQASIQGSENVASRHIRHERHDGKL